MSRPPFRLSIAIAAAVALLATIAVRVLLLPRPEAPGTDALSLRDDIQPIFNVACVSCHLHGQAIGTLDLAPDAAYASLVGEASTQADMPRVEPGSPGGSYLLHKLRGSHLAAGGSGERMPLHAPPLTEAQLTRIETWIGDGAHE